MRGPKSVVDSSDKKFWRADLLGAYVVSPYGALCGLVLSPCSVFAVVGLQI